MSSCGYISSWELDRRDSAYSYGLPDSEFCTRPGSKHAVDPGTGHVQQIRVFFVHCYLLHRTLVHTTTFSCSAVIHDTVRV